MAKSYALRDLVGCPEAVAPLITDVRPDHTGWHASAAHALVDLDVSKRIVSPIEVRLANKSQATLLAATSHQHSRNSLVEA